MSQSIEKQAVDRDEHAVDSAGLDHPVATTQPCLLMDRQHTIVALDRITRVALMVTPPPIGDAIDQAWEAVSTIRSVLKLQPVPMTVTMQLVFVRSVDDVPKFQKLFEAYYGDRMPTTSFVVQPPCGGQALAIEAWALGGDDVEVSYPMPDVVTVNYDGLHWVYIAGLRSDQIVHGAYAEAHCTFGELATRLEKVGVTFKDVPRIWLYQGGINDNEQTDSGEEIERYRELNRARTDFFDQQKAIGQLILTPEGKVQYAASTGIGMAGDGLVIGCLALQTDREDVGLLPLENPQQTSSFEYSSEFSIKSPKFSRAMAVTLGDYVTTWVSGTASILNSESMHLGDIEKQTEQTIDNIERLISRENFRRHGLGGAGAKLTDLAKVRVYVRRPEDYEKCQAVCRRRFGDLPTIYAQADICRRDLLVEIEGVAFSRIDSSTTDS